MRNNKNIISYLITVNINAYIIMDSLDSLNLEEMNNSNGYMKESNKISKMGPKIIYNI